MKTLKPAGIRLPRPLLVLFALICLCACSDSGTQYDPSSPEFEAIDPWETRLRLVLKKVACRENLDMDAATADPVYENDASSAAPDESDCQACEISDSFPVPSDGTIQAGTGPEKKSSYPGTTMSQGRWSSDSCASLGSTFSNSLLFIMIGGHTAVVIRDKAGVHDPVFLGGAIHGVGAEAAKHQYMFFEEQSAFMYYLVDHPSQGEVEVTDCNDYLSNYGHCEACDLSGDLVAELDLTLTDIGIRNSDCRETDFYRNTFSGGVNLRGVDLTNTLFQDSSLTHADFTGATLKETKFSGSTGLDPPYMVLDSPNFAGMTLENVHFTGEVRLESPQFQRGHPQWCGIQRHG